MDGERTNEWVLETAGVLRSLLAYYGHILRKKGDCLEKELIQPQAHALEVDPR